MQDNKKRKFVVRLVTLILIVTVILIFLVSALDFLGVGGNLGLLNERIPTAILLAIGILAGYLIVVNNGQPGLAGGQNIPFGPDDLASDPVPGRSGPYEVCVHDYDFSPDEKQWLFGRIYAPVFDEETCLTQGRFNLVLIAHADGQGPSSEAHTNYEALARHLASHALMVVSFNRYGLGAVAGAINIFDQVLQVHLDYLYNSSPIRDFITDNIALIGHSAGGRSVIQHAGLINDYGKSLMALVVLAPTVDLTPDHTFAGQTGAFLGLHVVTDSDAIAYGPKQANQVMLSTFKVYDDAGLIPGNPNLLSLEKDMVFVESEVTIPDGSHYFQNQPFTLAYLNAFLQLHLNGHSIFRRFFKFQERPPSLDLALFPNIWQQHADQVRLVLADFENDSLTTNTLNGPIQTSSGGIENLVVDDAYEIDNYSPHHTRVLKFDLDGSVDIGQPKFIRFGFGQPTDLQAFGYLSFRATQVYNPENNPSGTPKNFTIRLHSLNGEGEVNTVDFGGALHFPVIVPAPVDFALDGQTKNAMRSYLIRLSEFPQVDLGAVTGLTLDFTATGNEQTTFVFDDLEFYHL